MTVSSETPFLHQLFFISSPWHGRVPVLHSWHSKLLVSGSKHGCLPAQCLRDPLTLQSRGHAEKY